MWRVFRLLNLRHRHDTTEVNKVSSRRNEQSAARRPPREQCPGYTGQSTDLTGQPALGLFLQWKVDPMKTVHSEVCGVSRATEAFLLQIDLPLNVVNCNFSSLRTPQAEFQSPSIVSAGGDRNLTEGYFKTSAHEKPKLSARLARKMFFCDSSILTL